MSEWQPANNLDGIKWPSSPPQIPHKSHEITRLTYAGFWKRFAAAFIDGIILTIGGMVAGGIIGFIVGAGLGGAGINSETIGFVCGGFGYIAGLVLNWLYFTLFESSKKQATPGKLALGIIVTDMDGNSITFGRANGRYWGKIVSSLILLIGYLMAAFTRKKQALHDIMADCLVINRE